MKKKKTWREKLEKPQEPKVENAPKGKLATVTQIRDRLAKDYCADYTCSMTFGIFLWIARRNSQKT
jgi:hypothetical protein